MAEAIDGPRCPALLIAEKAFTIDSRGISRMDVTNAFLPGLGVPDFGRPATFSVVANILTPWSTAGQPFRARLHVDGANGKEVALISEAEVTGHRVPPYEAGDALQHLMALTARVKFPGPGRYWVALSIDGQPVARTPFRVLPV